MNWKDKIYGSFIGLFLGDSLGGPFEFATSIPINQYTGWHQFPTTTQFRFQERKCSSIGQVTDDSCFSIALATSLIQNLGFKQEEVIKEYLKLSNGPLKFLGRNTRTLFKGVKTVSGYLSRYAKMIETGVSQSNGSLMRISPMILLFHFIPFSQICESAILDTDLTNPCKVNREATIIYLTMFYLIYTDKIITLENIYSIYTPKEKDIINAITEGFNGIKRAVNGKTKGWVCNALYCTCYSMHLALKENDFESIMSCIVAMGGDTDTNMAISGALVGCYFGKDKLLLSQKTQYNLQVVLNCNTSLGDFSMYDTNGNELYHPKDIFALLEKF